MEGRLPRSNEGERLASIDPAGGIEGVLGGRHGSHLASLGYGHRVISSDGNSFLHTTDGTQGYSESERLF